MGTNNLELLIAETADLGLAPTEVDDFDRLQLLAMPLSGITHRFGVEGLSKRFMIAIETLSEADQQSCRRGMALGLYLHRSDTYSDAPYATHLLRVAVRLMRDYGIDDPSMISAAVLHDCLEDHGDDLIELAERFDLATSSASDALAKITTSETSRLVQGMTNPATPAGLTKAQRNEFYAQNVKAKIAGSFEVFLIKLSDFTDNAVGLHWSEDRAIVTRLAGKYFPVFDIFLNQVDVYEASGLFGPTEAAVARSQLTAGRGKCLDFLAL